MFAIQCINRFYKYSKFVGIRDNGLPYAVFEGNSDYPNSIHGFSTKEEAEAFATKVITREGLDCSELTTDQLLDMMLINNANKFQIIKFRIEDSKLITEETYQLPQFTRKDWY